MKFQIGKYYQHGSGLVISIIGTANTFFHGSCLLAEEEGGRLTPIGEDEDAARYWHEVSGWKRSCYAGNNIPDPGESTPREEIVRSSAWVGALRATSIPKGPDPRISQFRFVTETETQ
jgi:hypothetical protein